MSQTENLRADIPGLGGVAGVSAFGTCGRPFDTGLCLFRTRWSCPFQRAEVSVATNIAEGFVTWKTGQPSLSQCCKRSIEEYVTITCSPAIFHIAICLSPGSAHRDHQVAGVRIRSEF